MSSINKARIRQRVSAIFDQSHASQATFKSIKEYVKILERSVDIHKESMGSAEDFQRDFGAGI